MSSGGQIVGAVVGGVVGFVTTGPGGALKGAAYGASIGAALDPPPGPDLEGPRIADGAEQTSSYGAPVNTLNGKIGGKGTWIWVENNKKKIVAKKEDSGGGKGGGGGSETTTYEAFVTGAILLADHEVDGLGKLWFGPNLVSNGLATDLGTAAASSELFPTLHLHTDSGLLKASLGTNPKEGTVRLYPGYDDQPVDPRMEADLGAGNCPSYRGMTVLFLYDYPLKDYSNSIAGLQVKAELIVSDDIAAPVLLAEEERGRPDTSSYIRAPYLDSGTAYVYAVMDTVSEPVPGWSYALGLESQPYEYYPAYDGPDAYVPRAAAGWADQEGFPPDLRPFSASKNELLRDGYGLFRCETEEGHYYLKNGVYHYYDLVAPWRIYVGLSYVTYGSALAMVAVDNSGNIYAVSATEIKKYGSDLVLLGTIPMTLATEDTFNGTSRVMYDDSTDLLWIDVATVADEHTTESGSHRHLYAISFEEQYQSDPVVIPDGPFLTAGINSYNFTVQGSLYMRHRYIASGVRASNFQSWRLPTPESNGQSLASVVREKMEKSELIEPADIDVSLLTGSVRGYKTSGITSIRSTISPLMAAYNFDVIESGYQLKCVPRGQSSVMTIDYNDLDARPFGSAPGVAIDHQREMDSQLPRQMLLNYIDAGRNYNQNQAQSIERLSSKAINKESYELALVFTPAEAEAQASAQMDRRWLERDDFAFSLPQTYNRLEPADVVTLPTSYATYEFRLSSVGLLADGRVECTAKLNDSAIYTQNATGGTRIEGDSTISFAGKSVMHLLDIPLIRDEDNKPGFAGALTGKSTGWPGGTIIRSVDSGQTFQPVQGFVNPVTSGFCRDSLPAHDGYVIDRVNTLTIDLYNSGLTLSSITQEQMLTGKNWFAYGVAGRMEIGQYANAILNADGSTTIDTIVRGAKGTEQYTGTHEDGDLFIFLSDADAAFIAANVSDIGVERIYRGVTTGKDIDTVSNTLFTYSGVNLKPLSPVQLAGSIDGSDNWDVTWLRRSRLSSSWWTTGVVAPVGEDTESYEIDIMNGSTVVRTLTATSESVQYTSADQVADFGSNQTTLKFRVYQMSATVGRGHVAEVTL